MIQIVTCVVGVAALASRNDTRWLENRYLANPFNCNATPTVLYRLVDSSWLHYSESHWSQVAQMAVSDSVLIG